MVFHSARSGGVDVGRRSSILALMAALLSACLAFQLNASMLSPALVTMQRELDTTASSIAATQTAFFTAAALFSLFLPRLGDVIGRRRVLVAMLAVMALGCVIAAFASTDTTLFVGRLVQGVSGPTVPLCLVMLREEITTPKLYGVLMGVIAAVNGGIAGFDALLGGYLATNHGFASIFWTMAVVACLGAVVVRLVCPESTASAPTRMDWTGSGLLVASVGALLIAVNELAALSEAELRLVIPLVVVSIAAFGLFWRVESRNVRPLVSTGQLRERATWAVIGTAFLTLGGVFAIMNGIVPALGQDTEIGLQMSAEETSWWILTPYAIAGLLVGPLSGRLAATLGYRTVLRIGLAGTVVAMLLFVFAVGHDSRLPVLLLSIAVGVTYAGIANIMLNGLGVVLSPEERPGSLPGLNTGAFNLGAAISFVVIYAAQTLYTSDGDGSAGGYVAAFLTAAVILLGALALSLFIPRPVAAEVQR